jgi:hypothetical protein
MLAMRAIRALHYGNDYYVTNEHLVHQDGSATASGEIFGYYVITHQYYNRYGLPDQVDWDTALRENAGRVNPLGLYDLNRKIRAVGKDYKRLIEQWREILPTESFSLSFNY